MATNDITTTAGDSAEQPNSPVRFAIASIIFTSGGIPTIRIENEETGEVIAMTPREAAMNAHIIGNMTPEDALMIGHWQGREQERETNKLNAQELRAA